jgi:hypothetical protein
MLAFLALAVPGAGATSASARDDVRGPLRFCADPGHCGGNTMLSSETGRAEATARTFAGTWASDWNTWAAAHEVPQQIVTAGCNYLATEEYYLCAVRVRSHAPSEPRVSCALLVVKPSPQPTPNDQIENGLETACRIFSAFPHHVVD